MRDLSGSFQPLEKYLDLNIIPFGKSHSYVDSSSVQFQCQHGPRECRGNKLVSCALNRLTDQNAKVQFTYCFMVKYFFKMSDDFTQCANEAGINIKDVLSCSVSDEATQLQLQMETITNNYAITFVPTIVYNKVCVLHMFYLTMSQCKTNRPPLLVLKVLVRSIIIVGILLPCVGMCSETVKLLDSIQNRVATAGEFVCRQLQLAAVQVQRA
nr:unnamed protein product [Callosobruchus analis]